ncbi:DinB family protein [Acidobacteriota bacterium]
MDSTQDRTLVHIVEEQFACAWNMLREAVVSFPGNQWQNGEINYFFPARLAYHVIETVDYYCRDVLEGFQWGHRFGVDWESADPDRLPAQAPVLEYLDETQQCVSAWLHRLGDQGLVSPDEVFHQEGYTHLDRALYVLRHIHQHLGELCSELRKRDLPRPQWR